MRFILEYLWLTLITVSAVGITLIGTGLRDGKKVRAKTGTVVFLFAIVLCFLGVFIETPTEHANRVLKTFVRAVENQDESLARSVLHPTAIMVDQ